VFLPQRDGVEAKKIPYSMMSGEQRRQAMFEMDRDKIEACDTFFFLLDGRVPDEGACVELGIAYAHRRATRVNRLLIG
jgi:nucleoside 2-deoxyribosyltransferase